MKTSTCLTILAVLLTMASSLSSRWAGVDRQWNDIPSDRHNRAANLSFVDGHIETHRWRWPKANRELFDTAAKPGDLQDLRWLQARLPEP